MSATEGVPTVVAAPLRRRTVPPRTVLAVAALGVFMAFVDATIVNIAFPDMQRSFPTVTIAGLSWVLNAYNIVFAAFLVAAGRFADLLGRKRTFEAGLVLFTFASVMCAAATSPALLVAARIVQALGAAVVVPASLALVLEAFPARERAHAVALWTAVAALAAGIGPSLGGLLVEAGGWRLAFLVNVPVGIAAVALARSRLVESRAPGRRRLPDVAGALLFALAVATVTLAIVKGNDWGWTAPVTLATLAAGLLMGAAFGSRCRRHAVPLFDLELLRVRAFSVANALTVVGSAGFFAYTLCNVLFLTSVWRYSVFEAGLALTPGPFVAVALAAAGSSLAARVGPRAVIVPGALIWGLGVLYLVAFVGPEPDFLGEWLPGMVVLGVGAGLAFPNLSAAAVGAAPGERFATATALNSVARQLGAVLGVALLVAIVGTPAPAQLESAFDAGWTFAAVCLLLAAAGALALARLPELPGVPIPEPLAPAALEPTPRRAAAAVPAAPVLVSEGGAETPADLLARSPIFARLPGPVRAELAARGTEVRLPSGEWLFREGDPGDSLYVVRVGRLEVVREGPEPATLRNLGRGAVVGELALLTDDRRSASVRARRDSVLLRVDQEHFAALLKEQPDVAVALTRVLGEQLKESRALPPAARPVAVTVAVVPLDAGVAAGPLADRLAAALGAYGRVARLAPDADRVDGSDVLATYAPLMDRAERSHDHVVLAAGDPAAGDAWTGFCLSHADRILAVTTGGAAATPAAAGLHGCDLVGWDVAPGSGALGAWVEALAPAQAHVLHSGAALDDGIARLARRLAGRSVGLVLSGGGARAFAHLGVIEELDAAGVTIDRVAGASMGAFIGGMLAAGMDVDEMDARCYEEWMRRSPLTDYTLPRSGLIRGERMRAMLDRTFGALAIEELERGFVCASADLRSGTAVHHRFGLLWEQVGTSMCLPVLAAPRRRGKALLVDGSMIDNLPVGALAAYGEGPIVAVDIKAGFAPAGQDGRRRQGGEEPPPSMLETLTRVLLLASSNASRAGADAADLVVTVRCDGIGLLEFHQLDQAREAGRRAAHDALAGGPPAVFA
jgi:NTE family protein